MDLKDFCNTKVEKTQNQKIDIASNDSQLGSEAKKTVDKYKNYSSDELMTELIKKTNEQKNSGNLTPEKLQQIYNTIASVLPPENKQNLDRIFDRLK